MRRSECEIVDLVEIERVLGSCQVCHLALSTPDGEPYAVALNFGYAAGTPPALYFHCAREGRKLEFIRQNPRCAFIVDRPLELVTGPMACDWGMKYESVMGAGRIEILSDAAESRFGLNQMMAHFGQRSPAYRPEALDKALVLKLTIEQMTGKRRA